MLFIAISAPVLANSEESLAKQSQNPVGDIISVPFERRSQLVNATHALNLSAGVSISNVFRGRSLTVVQLHSAWLEWVLLALHLESDSLKFKVRP